MERLEIHHTPKHGSWLNMAEIELSVLARQCLDRRIPDPTTLAQEVAAWEHQRNAAPVSGRLAVHHARCAHQAEATLPVNSAWLRY